MRIAGRTHDLTDTQDHELGEYLAKDRSGGHPWPRTLAPSRGQRSRQAYVQAVPEVVVESAQTWP